MASPRSMPARPLASSERRYRRSAFNGSKQLSAAQAPGRRMLVLLVLLALGLLAAIAVIIGVHLQQPDDYSSAATPAAIPPATH